MCLPTALSEVLQLVPANVYGNCHCENAHTFQQQYGDYVGCTTPDKACCDADKPWELCGMDLFVEKPINRSKLECVLDQLQDQLGMQSSDCSSSEPLEPPTSAQEPDWASCCGPLPVTDFMVSSPGTYTG